MSRSSHNLFVVRVGQPICRSIFGALHLPLISTILCLFVITPSTGLSQDRGEDSLARYFEAVPYECGSRDSQLRQTIRELRKALDGAPSGQEQEVLRQELTALKRLKASKERTCRGRIFVSAAPSLTITSSAFSNWSSIPHRFTCSADGTQPAAIVPPLKFSGIPAKAKRLVLVLWDTTQTTTLNWIAIIQKGSPAWSGFRGGVTDVAGVTYEVNDYGIRGYSGPCPSSGTHRFSFSLYALRDRSTRYFGNNAERINAKLSKLALPRGQASLSGFASNPATTTQPTITATRTPTSNHRRPLPSRLTASPSPTPVRPHPTPSMTATPIPLPTMTPTPAINPTPLGSIIQTVAGVGHRCDLYTSGRVTCWGLNDFGQLGDGTTTSRGSPTEVIGLSSRVVQISAGIFHTCALLESGGVMCWGWNLYGQIGDGTRLNNRLSATGVVGLSSRARQVAAGPGTCALLQNGTVQCWGDVGTTPSEVEGLGSGVTRIYPAGSGFCAVFSSGRERCWWRVVGLPTQFY
jgi:phosphatidylethanolamine-binding protein (PEBP) family uncharacterized protein